MGSSSKKRDEGASRAERKAKKRKLEDAIRDLPGDDDANDAEPAEDKKSKKRKRDSDINGQDSGADNAEKKSEKEKKDKKEKKRKIEEGNAKEALDSEKVDGAAKKRRNQDMEREGQESEDGGVEVTGKIDVQTDAGEEVPKKSKKERKAERKAKEAAEKAAQQSGPPVEPEVEVNGEGEGKGENGEGEEKKAKKNNRNREKKRLKAAAAEENGEKKDPRFIVFVGNLPFGATTDSITKHFASMHPKSVRHLTQKDKPTKSKGCAFVEFEGYDHMKTCLKLMHHSTFDDGISPPRKINVELTAGGGGNTKDRRAKITEKNQKLNEQRFRRIQEEKAKWEKKKESGAIDESAIHPSRRARVPGA